MSELGTQATWLAHLGASGKVEWYIFRPRDWSSGRIEAVLMGTAPECAFKRVA